MDFVVGLPLNPSGIVSILENYDPICRCIRLPRKRILYIGEEDVQMTSGFPKGNNLVQRSKKQDGHTFMDDVVEKFTRGKWLMKPTDVEKVMLKNENGEKSTSFNGPITFLVLFYVDRVIHCSRTVHRAYPAYKGWDTEYLMKRQEVELKVKKFGFGCMDKRYNPNAKPAIIDLTEQENDAKAKEKESEAGCSTREKKGI
ncbi:hypothetical protein AAHA92_15806 [Salvia divinorum]|uniref:Uncharacterized protein n=1 Tax=Salvia divinorum TaxID=28513 RepID=A0ABD1HFZ7_SALDI